MKKRKLLRRITRLEEELTERRLPRLGFVTGRIILGATGRAGVIEFPIPLDIREGPEIDLPRLGYKVTATESPP